MIIAGIDPGKTGALAITFPDGAVLLHDVPIIKVGGKERPAWTEWAQKWSAALEFAAPNLIVIELVSAMPGQGVTSMFTFGRALGFAHAVAVAGNCRIEFVTSATWKGKLGLLNSGKGASREKARTLYPRASHAFERAKDDGRAEATLLAHYGRKYLC